MTRKHRIKWLVVPKELPAVLRRCPKCGKKTEYENSGKFRVNANGSLLDIWLIYRCESCETSLNMAVYERIAAKDLDSGEYMGFLSNDAALAARYGSSREVFAANRAEQVLHAGEYTVRETKLSEVCLTQEWDETEISLEGAIKIRVDALFARQWGISRSRVKELCIRGLLRDGNGMVDPGMRVRDGQLFYSRNE